MSIQPLPSVSPSVDSAAPRRSNADESGRGSEAFALPAEAPAREPERPAAPSRSPAQNGDDRAAAEAASSGSAKSDRAEAGAAKFDAGALVSIAGAEPGAEAEAAGQAAGAVAQGTVKPARGRVPLKGQESDKTNGKESEVPAETGAAQIIVPTPIVAAEAVGTQTAEPIVLRDAIAEIGTTAPRGSAEGARKISPQAGQAPMGHAQAAKEAVETPQGATGEIALPQTEGAGAVPAGSTKAGQAESFKAAEGQQVGQTAADSGALVQQVSAKIESLRILSGTEATSSQHAVGAGTPSTATQPTPLHVVPIEIGLKALSGMRQFDIRLDPAELGRVDVNLSISDDGSVSAKLVVDRVETLHLLQRDARTLERAFEQAGLKPSDGGVDISLRDQSDQSAFRQRQQEEGGRQSRSVPNEPAADETIVAVDPAPVRRLVRLGGVDLSI